MPNLNMPRYKCHKEVHAAKILQILRPVADQGAPLFLVLNNRCSPVAVTKEWLAKHKPEAGGYLVMYKDGYTSYSPAAAFEAGYTMVTDDAPKPAEAEPDADAVIAECFRLRVEENAKLILIRTADDYLRVAQSGEAIAAMRGMEMPGPTMANRMVARVFLDLAKGLKVDLDALGLDALGEEMRWPQMLGRGK